MFQGEFLRPLRPIELETFIEELEKREGKLSASELLILRKLKVEKVRFYTPNLS